MGLGRKWTVQLCESRLGQGAGLVPVLGDGQGTEEVVLGAVEPLTLAISGWMVRFVWLFSMHPAEMLDEIREVPALVRVATRHSNLQNHSLTKVHCRCPLVVGWDGSSR